MQLKAINQVYVKAKIYEGGNSLIYRGTRQQDGQPVVLKLLKHDYPTPFQMACHRHEYEIVKSLEAVPGVIQTYGLEQYQKTLVTVLEDFGGVSLQQVLAKRYFSIQAFLPLAIRLTQTLEAIHQHQIIHRNINPANIVFNVETGKVKLIDFELATLLSRQTPALKSLRQLEGTLNYLSPEQTGRMNRAVDYRSDFYSLGATFYEMLTGRPPFQTPDPLELLHAHLARQPMPAQQVNPEVPAALSDIVMRLLAKNAEDRYQSAYGITADLQLCWKGIQTHSRSLTFTVGRYDIPARFQLSQKLYGREAELQQLFAAFEHANQAQGGLVLVSGYAGVGKSALVKELYRPLSHHRGYFIAGKFDQYRRDIPYSALLQAFQSLVNQILTESHDNIEVWKNNLREALGTNAQVIIDVIPEVELIVGPQPPVVPLGSTEAQNRFTLVFQNFVRVFSKPTHPLVLFLDDLQWADTASLSVLQSLVTLSPTQCLLLIGAYRDHEVSAGHPLAQVMADLQQSQAIAQIRLHSLTFHNVQQLLADSLNTPPANVADLAALMIEKTDGNPFFLGQLLHYLYDEGFLQFEVKSHRWQWDNAQIQAVHMTDNVIDLMTHKLQKLPIATQELLKFAACIGNQFELQILATIREEPLTTVIHHLLEAIQSHVLVPESDAYHLPLNLEGETALDLLASDGAIASYRFLHDRVQQAAYTLIPLDDRQKLHLKIGRLLLQQGDPGDRKTWLFNVVNQFNQGCALITDSAEKRQLAALNLQAGQHAKTCIAYGPAVKYLTTGIDLLEADSWTEHYRLTFDLHREQFECEYLRGHFDQAEALFKQLLEHAQTPLDRAEIYSLQIILCTTLGKFQDVIELGRQGLKQLGWTMPQGQTWVKWVTTLELLKIKQRLGNRPIAEVIHRPEMKEPFKLAQINLMSHIIPALYYIDMDLSAYFYLKMASLSLKYGNTATSAVAYLGLGRFLGEQFQDAQSRYAFGKLAIQLVERLNCPALKCKTYFLFGGFINHWTQPSHEDLDYLKTAYQAGIEYGDLSWAAYANNVMSMRKLILGICLREQEQDIQAQLAYTQQVGERYTPCFLTTTQQVIRCLMGLTQADTSLSDEDYDEEQQVAFLQAQPGLVGALNWYYVAKTTILYLFEQYEPALAMSLAAQQTIGAALGLARVVHHCFYFSLSITARYAQLSDRDRRHYHTILNRNLKQLKQWANQGPQNYQHRYWLVVAETARIRNQPMKAQEFYEKTVQWLEKQHPVHQHELALAHELAARFHHAAGRSTITSAYLQNARYHYQQWGAVAKVRALETQYAHLLPLNSTSPVWPLSQQNLNSTAFDLETALRSAQAISNEIQMERLPTKIIQIIIENAGAETGHLLLHQAELLIAATATTQKTFEPQDSVAALPIDSRQQLPWSVVHYVARTQSEIVLDDATQSHQFSQDPHIAQHQVKSLLCVPIVKQTQLMGVLYLENNQATAVFTPDRIQLLHVLAAQAAIALENARLYQSSQGQVAELEKLNRLKDDFLSTVSHELRTPMSNIKMATQMLEITLERAGYLAEKTPAARYFQILKEEGEREIGLINDLLDLTRLEAEADPLQSSAISLQILLPYLAESFQDRIQSHHQQLQIEIDPELPDLESDRGYLERIVMELLNNACKYTPEGESIIITASARSQDIEFRISNTGVEIPEKEQGLIFNKFYRIPNNDPWKHGGTGLGLALTQRLVKRLGATIRVESGAGRTTFVVTFPEAIVTPLTRPNLERES